MPCRPQTAGRDPTTVAAARSCLHHRVAVVALGAVLLSSIADAQAAPSFLCRKATTWTERTICGSERLSGLDLELAVVRARLLKNAAPAASRPLEAEQQHWWTALGECRRASDSASCVAGRYEQRIQALRAHPAYPGDRPRAARSLESAPIKDAGRGWTRELAVYLRALHACREEAPAPIGKLLVAWPTGDGESVSLRLLDWHLKEWVCIAHRDGHKVFRFEPRRPEDRMPDAGPVYHVGGETPPPNCAGAAQVVDPNGKPAGWVSERDC